LSGQEGRVEKFKELVKSGISIRRALKESRLHLRYYKEHYVEIWSDPELESYRPAKFRKLIAGEVTKMEAPKIEGAERRLAEYAIPEDSAKSQLERELGELELKRRSLAQASARLARLLKPQILVSFSWKHVEWATASLRMDVEALKNSIREGDILQCYIAVARILDTAEKLKKILETDPEVKAFHLEHG